MGYDHVPRQQNDQAGGTTYTPAGGEVVKGSGLDAAGAATKYLTAPGQNHAASAVILAVAHRACVLRDLRVNLVTAPAGSDTYIVTVIKSVDNGANFTDTSLTCTITGTAKSASDTTHTPSIAAGDVLAIKVVSSATTAAAATARFEIV